MDNKQTEKELKNFSKELISNFIGELISQGKIASGKLKDSFEYDVFNFVSTLRIDFSAEDYLIWLEKGRKSGKYAPKNAIEEWVKVKGIATEEKKIKSIAFLVNRKIFEKGIKPSNIISNVLKAKNIEESLGKRIEGSLQHDFQKMIDNLVDQYWNKKG